MGTMEKSIRHVARLADEAKKAMQDAAPARELATEYYNGVMSDFTHDEGRSSLVSRDVRATVKKLLPSVTRTILGGEKIVQFMPQTQEDERDAEDVTDYINHVAVPECDVENAIYDACHDAILLKTGILKWSAYSERTATTDKYEDQSETEFMGMHDAGEVLDHEETDETDDDMLAEYPNAKRHSFNLRSETTTTKPKLECISRDRFIKSPGATGIDNAGLVGEVLSQTRSDFVSMGYDKKLVWQIGEDDEDDTEKQAREGDDYEEQTEQTRKAQQVIECYEVYVRLDLDGDGISELHRVVFGDNETGEEKNYIILGTEEVSEAPYAEVKIEREPHQFEGRSVYEDARETQRTKTQMLRGGVDNMLAVNNPVPAVDFGKLQEPDDAFSGEFGKPIYLKAGALVRDAIQWMTTPFTANHAFAAMQVIDEVGQEATGVTDASGGLDAGSIQNVSATAAHIASEGGIAQADSAVRTLSKGGLEKAFRGLLKLTVTHADDIVDVKIGEEWKRFDPSVWNSDMKCRVNIGLGGGTKERDIAALSGIYERQKELALTLGPSNPYVKPEQLFNTLEKLTEAAGFASARPFFTKPDPEEVQAQIEAAKNQPNPEMEKMKGQFQLEQIKIQGAQAKEEAQMQADIQVEQARLERSRADAQDQLAIQREDIASKERLKMAEIEASIIIAREKAQTNAAAPVPDILQGGLHG